MIHALVLAAGESKRMGMPKPLLRFSSQSRSCIVARASRPCAADVSRPDQEETRARCPRHASEASGDAHPTRNGDTTFLERIIAVLRESKVDRTTVVLGARADTVRASVDLSAVEVVVNEDYSKGQLSSLIKGLRSLPDSIDVMLLCLVDHPFITAEVIDRLILAFKKSRQPIVLPVFEGRRGHPTLFAKSLFGELANAPIDKGARHVVSSNADKVLEVNVADRGVLVSVDTPEDYRSCFGAEPQVIAKKP